MILLGMPGLGVLFGGGRGVNKQTNNVLGGGWVLGGAVYAGRGQNRARGPQNGCKTSHFGARAASGDILEVESGQGLEDRLSSVARKETERIWDVE